MVRTAHANEAVLPADGHRSGQEYIKRSYRWDVVLAKYEQIFSGIKNAR